MVVFTWKTFRILQQNSLYMVTKVLLHISMLLYPTHQKGNYDGFINGRIDVQCLGS